MPVVDRRILLSVIAASLPLLAAATASAEAPIRPFGPRRHVVLDDLVSGRSSGIGFLGVLSPAAGSFGPFAPPAYSGLVGYGHDEVIQGSTGALKIDVISVAPSLDVFVANRVSLGAMVGF